MTHYFFFKQKILLHINGYFILKNSFVAEATLKSNIARNATFEENYNSIFAHFQ